MKIKHSQKTTLVLLAAFLAMLPVSILVSGSKIIFLTFWIIVLAVLSILSIRMLGFKHDDVFLYHISLKRLIAIFALILFLLGLIGIYADFSVRSIDSYTYLVFFALLFLELFRHSLQNSYAKNFYTTASFSLISLAAQMFIMINIVQDFSIETMTLATLNIILSELICIFLSQKIGFKITLLYHCLAIFIINVLPIWPNMELWLNIVFICAIPCFAYSLLSRSVLLVSRSYKKARCVNITFLTLPIMIVAFCYALIISGLAPLRIIAIASDSMRPSFSRGDALIYRKDSEITDGDILIFNRGDEIITHRVVSVIEQDGLKYYRTKGDANDVIDDYLVSSEDVIGRAIFINHYIGYPALFINGE